ncbi:hypothetical protein PG630_01100 [Riemerella anatipestifer]|nr:hypothetical protein [Riemerella anatipestifer]
MKPDNVKGGFGYVDNGIEEKNLYFYHPDHLGSSSYITDKDGNISQHTEYIAFGEVLFDEHKVSRRMPYLFNGKELDSETGLYYYGARYYDARVSLWLNVDPLAEKYPFFSPYIYTFNNPIKFIDPDGRDPITGLIDALSSFALDVGMDFFGGILIEGKTAQQSYNDIGWWSAGLNAVGAYAVSAVTPTGTATSLKIAKLMSNKKVRVAAEVVASTISKMTTKAIDKYSQGKYDDKNGNFDFDKVSLTDLFWESSIETLLEKGFGGQADELMETLAKQEKVIAQKMSTLQKQVANGASKKRTKTLANDIKKLQGESYKTLKKQLKTKTAEKVIIGGTSKTLNQETNPTNNDR